MTSTTLSPMATITKENVTDDKVVRITESGLKVKLGIFSLFLIR